MAKTATGNNRTQQLLNELGLAIVKGKYNSERPFPTESELCDQYGVSRSIVREVVKVLSAMGMLASKARKGTWVLPASERNVLDPQVLMWMLSADASLELLIEFVEIRREIEPAAAALAAEYADEESLQAIETALERMRCCQQSDDESEALEADIAFHLSILNASGNRFMMQMRHLVESALRVSIQLTNESKGVAHASFNDHKEIALNIRKGNASSARAKTLKLIDETYELIKHAKLKK